MSLQAPIAPVAGSTSRCRTTPWNSRGVVLSDCHGWRKLMYVMYASAPSGEIAIAGKFGRSPAGEAEPADVVGQVARDRIADARLVDVRDDLSRPHERLAAVGRAGHEDCERLRPRVDAVPEDVDVAVAVGVHGAVLPAADRVVVHGRRELAGD